MEPAHFPSAILAEFYRFALLLTGEPKAAEQVLALTLGGADAQLGQLRSEASRHAWVARRIREQCLGALPPATARGPSGASAEGTADPETPDPLTIEALAVARRFHLLPEPERSALALFYLDLFTVEEVAKILEIPDESIGAVLVRARALLADAPGEVQQAESSTA